MHFYHMYIVEAYDADEAFSEVENRLESYQYDVWDYYKLMDEKKREESIKLITKDNYNKLFEVAEKKIQHTQNELEAYKKRLLNEMKRENITSFDELKLGDGGGMLGFYLRRIGGLVAGFFMNDTFFFDWAQESPQITEEQFKKYAEKGGYYVVFMNLHN